jgi:hypothetical protein
LLYLKFKSSKPAKISASAAKRKKYSTLMNVVSQYLNILLAHLGLM